MTPQAASQQYSSVAAAARGAVTRIDANRPSQILTGGPVAARSEDLGGWLGLSIAEIEGLRARRDRRKREGALSAPLIRPITRGNVDLVHSVVISFSFAEDRAMLAFEVDPGDIEPKFFGVTAE